MVRSKLLITLLAAGLAAPLPALAQSAGSAGSGASPGVGAGSGTAPSPSTPAPSGGVPTGRSASGPETPLQSHEEHKMEKETTICKGC